MHFHSTTNTNMYGLSVTHVLHHAYPELIGRRTKNLVAQQIQLDFFLFGHSVAFRRRSEKLNCYDSVWVKTDNIEMNATFYRKWFLLDDTHDLHPYTDALEILIHLHKTMQWNMIWSKRTGISYFQWGISSININIFNKHVDQHGNFHPSKCTINTKAT